MAHEKDLRVVISCVTFDTVKIVEPIKYYRADKVYLIHKADRDPYGEFLQEVKRQLDDEKIKYEDIYADVNKFTEVMTTLVEIIEKEKGSDNKVFVNVEAGSSVYCSASLIASMMYGCTPFNVGTREHTIKNYRNYYSRDGRPIGLASKVNDPYEVPEFHIERPRDRLVEGLKIWNDVKHRYGKRKLKETISSFQENGLLKDCLDDRGKVTHSGQMQFRRKYLDKWREKGWIQKDEDGNYRLSPDGEFMIEVF